MGGSSSKVEDVDEDGNRRSSPPRPRSPDDDKYGRRHSHDENFRGPIDVRNTLLIIFSLKRNQIN